MAKIIRLIVQEMEDTLVEVRSAAVRTIAERKERERRVDALRLEREEWQRRAELAVTRGREDLAKGAIVARTRIGEALAREEHQLAQLAQALDKENEDIAKLQAKLADAKAREKTLTQRHKSAASRIRLRTQLYDERITDAFARFEHVERALDEMEGRGESFDLGRKGTLADELAGIEKDARVEEELAELKARLGNRTRGRCPRDDRDASIWPPSPSAVIFLVVVAPIWIVAHYLTRWRRARKLSAEDERSLGDLFEAARRMEARLAALERVLDAEAPEWRTRVRDE